MYYTKYPYSANFEFVRRARVTATGGRCSAEFSLPRPGGQGVPATAEVRSYPGGVHHLTFRSELWPVNHLAVELDFDAAGAGDPPGSAAAGPASAGATLELTPQFQLRLADSEGLAIIQTDPKRGFGVCGTQSMIRFRADAADRFYGMGEKWLDRLELSRMQTRFWNTDVLGDFDHLVCEAGAPDPVYASIPWLIVRRGDTFVGILVVNPGPVFMSTGATPWVENLIKSAADDCFVLGCESGPLDLVVIHGPTPAGLTRKLQRLVGVTPLPPAWALGYHQCRWGYASREDLARLNELMDAHRLPCDGIWLDIGYMDGFRLFTFDPACFPEPARDLAEAQQHGRHVVPILDPGIKKEPGYPVYDSGLQDGAFCLNPHGNPYVGIVWPGETVFPDFSTERGRAWWTRHVEALARLGIGGFWIDMNDPSTGSVAPTDMLFDGGRLPHESFHNQYALGMAMATREGLEQAHPDERPFLLSRSASTGSGRYTAVWSGDNFSNYLHLKRTIPTALNLALSGIPFNGPDVGGFAGDVTESLFLDWIKACFLFPFFRIHSAQQAQAQEPWAFSDRTLEIAREYIQLRYRLRPHLYQLFVRQETAGEPVLRPLMHDYPDDRRFDETADAFLVGADLLHAPFVTENDTERVVDLPAGLWYGLDTGEWTRGGGSVRRARSARTTPLFARAGAVLPWSAAPDGDQGWDGGAVRFLVALSPEGAADTAGAAGGEYVWDDGHTLAYRRGERSTLRISAAVTGPRARTLAVEMEHRERGAGVLRPAVMIPGSWEDVRLTLDGTQVRCRISRETLPVAGCEHRITVATPASAR